MVLKPGSSAEKGQPGLVRAALFALCPVCGVRRDGLAPCRGCGLDFAATAPSGRGLYPLVLPLVVALVWGALAFDEALHPPLWVDALVFAPLVIGVIGGAVRLVQVAHWRRMGKT